MAETNLIFSYTRKEAIEDGMQAELTGAAADMFKKVYKYPVYITCGISGIVERAVKNGKDYMGVMWDILWMSVKNCQVTGDNSRSFQVKISGRKYTIWVECGAKDIDEPEPVLTFMLPEEN